MVIRRGCWRHGTSNVERAVLGARRRKDGAECVRGDLRVSLVGIGLLAKSHQ